MANTYTEESKPGSAQPESGKGGTKAAAVALGGTAGLAGAAFLASQYLNDESDVDKTAVTDVPKVEEPKPAPDNSKADTDVSVDPVKNETTGPKLGDNHPAGPGGGHDDSGNGGGGQEGPSFDEAFAEARADHGGGGGHFTWRGDVYNTYTVEEWADMSPGEKRDFLAGVLHGTPSGLSHDDDLISIDSPEDDEVAEPVAEIGEGSSPDAGVIEIDGSQAEVEVLDEETRSDAEEVYVTSVAESEDVLLVEADDNADIALEDTTDGPNAEGHDFLDLNHSDGNDWA
ncbi:hypothetical protein [Dyadobacter jiangsuensis]|uniref:Uncharacterized protein n=1 Tax=Dyadobacter jiangsuensis TaxID=1591085 RepID=A0A2P8G0C6_9BACT|nr:hypothetical protein [Dyadobacter jiangsuensis]PSL27421.1 hypothetical protein CLV60_108279 [Dyadobacter jiangsuensis]